MIVQLPIAVAHFFSLGFWLVLLHRPGAPSLHPIHPLMSLILLVNSLTSLTRPIDSRDDPLIQCIRLLLVLSLTALLVQITLALLVPLRQNSSKKAVTAVIVAQIVANVVMGEMEGTITAVMASTLVDVMGGFSVLGCVLWHMAQLREELKGAKRHVGRRNVDRVRMFLQWYIGVVALHYATRMWSFGLGRAAEEIARMACYAGMFYCFRPEAVKKSEYLATAEEEAEEAPLTV